MRLLALRAAAFRRFAEGIRVENFAPGVNLLAGPNELGKSTLFQALEAAFLLRHVSTGLQLDSMRPRSGGEPLVEADFETAGRRWRIRKQFGRGKVTILSDLDSGAIVARAAEAEDQLAALLGGARPDSPGRIGLMWVRQQRALQPPDLDVDTETGKPKMRGEAKALMDLLTSEVVEAAGSGDAERIAKRARADLESYVTAGRGGPKKGGPYEKALNAREQARTKLEQARDALARSEERLKAIENSTAYLAEQESPAARAALEQRIELLERALTQAGAQREREKALAGQVRTFELEAKEARRVHTSAIADVQRCTALRAALETATQLQAALARDVDDLNANRLTAARLAALEKAISLAEREALVLSDLSTRIDVDLLPEGEGRISIKGDTLQTGVPLLLHQAATLGIDGIGKITITPPGTNRAAQAARRRAELADEIARLQTELGVSGLDEARSKSLAREALVVKIEDARRNLAAIAPRGSGALQEELATLETSMLGLDLAQRAQEVRDKDVQVLAARNALQEMQAQAVDETEYQALVRDLAEAKRALQFRHDETRRASDRLAQLRGEQSVADEQGLAHRVEEAAASLQRAEQDVARAEDDIAALKLLLETLSGLVEGARTRYLEPVGRALWPYLARVFPGAGAQFKEGFSLQALTRAGEAADFSILSDGTREQLAVLVRMGFARLFAERGAPVPLVLDDPLVYSDDERLAAMCEALGEAGRLHQVVVLTCRQSAFAQLGGHRLQLSPWRDA